MLHRVDAKMLWLAWIVAASAAFTVYPVGPVGLLGWYGALGSLLPSLHPKLGRRVIGSTALLLAAFGLTLDPALAWLDVAAVLAVLGIGLWLTPSGAWRSLPEAGPGFGLEEFRRALARELARARRFERPITVFSAAGVDRGQLDELHAAIAAEVQLFCFVVTAGERVLVLVPELGGDGLPRFEARIAEAVSHLGAVELGHSSFPGDRVTSAALIADADASRRLVAPCGESERDRRNGNSRTELLSP